MFGKDCFFTDDTVMTVAVADALMQCADDIELFKQILIKTMLAYGRKYPDAGYGGSFSDWLYNERIVSYNSFGNGSAMRVSPVAWYADSLHKAIGFARASAEVTHNHPEGIKGAVVTAGAIYLARTGASIGQIKEFVSGYYDMSFTLDDNLANVVKAFQNR